MKSLATRCGLTLASMTLAAVATLAPHAHAATNLLANPGFETSGGSYSGWFTFGAGVQMSTPATDNIAHTGTAASKIYGGFNGCPGSPIFNVGGCGQAFTAPTVGNTYTFSGYSYVSSGDPMIGSLTCSSNRLIAKVVFFNALSGGSEIESNEIVIGDSHTPVNTWVPFTVSAPCPAGAQRVESDLLFLQPGCDGGSVFTDDLSLTSTFVPTPQNLLTNSSFTSGLTGWTTFGNVFTESRSFGVRTTTGSAKMFSTFVSGSPSGLYQRFAQPAGKQFVLGAYTLNTCQESPIDGVNDNFVTAKIVYRDAGNNELSNNEVVIADNTSPFGTWTYHTVSGTSPANTAFVEAYILFNSPSLYGGAIWVDDVLFQRTDLVAAGSPSGTPGALALATGGAIATGGAARLDFTLPRAGNATLGIYDLSGRVIATVAQGSFAAGPHVATWNGRTAGGSAAASGIYQAVLQTSAGRVARRLILAR